MGRRNTIEVTPAWLAQRLARSGAKTAETVQNNGPVARAHVQRSRMNKTERAYQVLLEMRKVAGEIAWYDYEAFKLKLADNTFYTPDFPVRMPDGSFQMHEVKGHMRPQAAVKLKVAQRMFPFFRFIVVRKEKGGGWSYKDVANGL